MTDEQKSGHLGRGIALFAGLLLLVALTAYIGATTTPSDLFAEEDEGPSAEDLQRLKDEKRGFQDHLKDVLRQYKDNSRQLKSKSQGPESDITRITKELQSTLRSSNMTKLPADYRADVERQAKELLTEITGLAQKIKDARTQARTAFDALAPLYQQVAAIKLNVINDLDAFEDARGLVDELQQELNNAQNDANDANQDFYGGEYWQKKDRIRNLIELPKQLTDFEKTLARSEKAANSKSLMKLEKLYADSFTISGLKERVKTFKDQVQAIRDALKSGNVEDLQNQVQELHEARIFDLEGVINRFKELGDLLPRLFNKKALKQNTEVRDAINEVVVELLRRVSDGDIDQNIHNDFNELMQWLYDLDRKFGQQSNFKDDDPLFNKIRGLKDKFDRENTEQGGAHEKEMPQPIPTEEMIPAPIEHQ